MKRILWLLLALALLLGCSSPFAATAERALAPTPRALPSAPHFGAPAAQIGDRRGMTLEEVSRSTGTILTNTGSGSGFVIHEGGYVATCYHVVGDHGFSAETVEGVFVLEYGTNAAVSYPIEGVVAYSESEDVAIIKVDAAGLIPLPIGDSDALALGDDVYIVGSPKGLRENANSAIRASVSKKYTNPYGLDEVQLSAGTGAEPGASGSAVVRLIEGTGEYEAVGVFAASYVATSIKISIPIIALPSDYLGKPVIPLAKLNEDRRYFVRYPSDGDAVVMGERYSEATSGARQATILSRYADGETWLYDRFHYDADDEMRRVDGLMIERYASGNFFIKDCESSYLNIGYNENNDDPFYYFSVDDDGAFVGYCAVVYEDGYVNLGYRADSDDGINEISDRTGDHIVITGFGEAYAFYTYEGSSREGFCARVNDAFITFYTMGDDDTNGPAVRFEFATSDFQSAEFEDGYLVGSWATIKPSAVPEIIYQAVSADAGSLTYGDFSCEWTDGGKSFSMESETRRIVKTGDDWVATIQSNNAFKPHLRVTMCDGDFEFSASATEYRGFVSMREPRVLLIGEAAGRIAQVAPNAWYVGELGTGTAVAGGKGSLYDPLTDTLYVGEFADGEPHGEGAWLNVSYNPLTGEWDGIELTKAAWR